MAAPFKGFFQLQTPRDLFNKAQRELETLRQNPTDSDAAFNFVASARHVSDWLAANGGATAKSLFDAHVELRICRQLVGWRETFRGYAPYAQAGSRTEDILGRLR